jgi:hypothetical protein
MISLIKTLELIFLNKIFIILLSFYLDIKNINIILFFYICFYFFKNINVFLSHVI